MELAALYKNGYFFAKAYKVGDDWQVKSNGHKEAETWASVWRDNKLGSLKGAIRRHCEINNIIFYDDPSFLDNLI